MSALAENEILREGRRVLRKLTEAKARLVETGNGRWTVVQRGSASSGRVKTSAEMVAAFHKRGWLDAGADDALVLSAVGRTWLTGDLAGADPYSAQHQLLRIRQVRDDSGHEATVVLNDGESPLGWLKARGAIDARQFEAGEKLRRDYTLAQLEPRMCIDLSAPVVLGRGPANPVLSDTVIAAKQRLAKALSAVGPGLSDLLFDICCALKGLEAVELAKGWPRRSGKVVLTLALDRLAAHYGIREAPTGSRLRSWSADNLEPEAA
jgi:hypothetical protein